MKPATHPLRILLAEDNAINQELASRLLSNRGHDVTVVDDGQAALEAYRSATGAFDLILMDVQMPNLDGLAATAAIRDAEQAGGHRIPIVAMTAHAREGDRERLLAAGMDGYVAKPLVADALLEAIAGALGEEVAAPRGAARPATTTPVDWSRALEAVDGDASLLRDLAGIFLEAAPGMLADVRAAVDADDGPRLERAAHRLAGAIGNFAAGAASAQAGRLEAAGAAGTLGGVSEWMQPLESEVERVCRALARHVTAGYP